MYRGLWHIIWHITPLPTFDLPSPHLPPPPPAAGRASRGHVVIDGDEAVNEADDADDGRRDQGVRVEPQPGEVHADLDAKVVFHIVQRLVSVELAQVGPLVVEQRARVT